MEPGGQSRTAIGVKGKPSSQNGGGSRQIFQPRSATEGSDLHEMLVHRVKVFLPGPKPLKSTPCSVRKSMSGSVKNLGWSPPKVLGETNCRIDDLRSFRDNWDFGHMLQRLHMDPALTMVIQWLLNQWWCPKMCWCSCWSPSWWSRCYLQPFGKHLARVGSCSVHRNLVWCFNNPPSQLGSSSQILRISWDIKMI